MKIFFAIEQLGGEGFNHEMPLRAGHLVQKSPNKIATFDSEMDAAAYIQSNLKGMFAITKLYLNDVVMKQTNEAGI